MTKLALVFDTETTGLFNYQRRADQKGQPRLCTMAAALIDMETGDNVEQNYWINNGGDWDIDDWRTAELGEAFKINGLTTGYLREHGTPIMGIIQEFNRMVDRCVGIVAYSVAFDQKVLRGESRRNNMKDRYGERPTFDPMWACRHYTSPGNKKTMKLTLMYKALFGEDFAHPHTAQGDLAATIAIFNYARTRDGIEWRDQISKLEMEQAAPAGAAEAEAEPSSIEAPRPPNMDAAS